MNSLLHTDFRKEVAALIQNNPSWNKLKIPAKYYQVKEALEKLFISGNKGNSKEHIRGEADWIDSRLGASAKKRQGYREHLSTR